MTVLTLDQTLEPIAPRSYPGDNPRERVIQRCLSDGARTYDWKTKTTTETELVHATSIPETADAFHANYLGYLQHGWAHHRSIVLAPQHFWYTTVAEIARAVKANADLHRPIFTRDPAGKIDIIVPCASETEPLRLDAIYGEIVGHVPVDVDLFLPTFSTQTESSRLATLAAFLEAASPYYNYMMLACGFPAIRLEGTATDWGVVLTRTATLAAEFNGIGSPIGKWLETTVGPTAEKILAALNGGNPDWFRSIFSQKRCGSGSQHILSGWWSNLFMGPRKGIGDLGDYPPHITKVPYTTLPSGAEWNLCFALTHSVFDADGFLVPDFGWVQVRKLSTPRVSRREE